MDYNARFYSPYLGRFVSPDTILPDATDGLALDRYAYVRNNSVNATDPTGHSACWDNNANDPSCIKYTPTGKGLTSVAPSVATERLLRKLSNREESITWNNLEKVEQNVLLDAGWDPTAYNHSDHVLPSAKDIAGTVQDPVVWLVGLSGAERLMPQVIHLVYQLAGPAYVYAQQTGGTSLWPSSWNGREVVNGITYSIHALYQMSPVGLGGRGVPPSAVENALNFGVQTAGRFQNTMVYTFENVVVVWNYVENVVVTVIKTGH